MSFDVRCPSCRSKLRLAEEPDPGVMIECPKCNKEFPAPSEPLDELPPEKAGGGKPEKPPEKPAKPAKLKTVEVKDREFMNEFALLGIVGFVTLLIFGTLFGIWVILNRAGRTEDLICSIPEEYNVISGCNVGQMSKLPGYKEYTEKIYTAEINSAFKKIAAGLGIDPESGLVYFVFSQNNAKGNKLYLFNLKKATNPSDLDRIEGIHKDPRGYTFKSGVFAGMYIDCPTPKIIIVASKADELNKASNLAKNKSKTDGMYAKIGAAGKLAIRGHFFKIILKKSEFAPKANDPDALRSGIGSLDTAYYGSPIIACWCTFGSTGLRLGAAIDLKDEEKAKDFLRSMEESELGKGEDYTPGPDLKRSIPVANVKKEWGEFQQYLKFKVTGSGAYITSKIDSESGRGMFFDVLIGKIE